MRKVKVAAAFLCVLSAGWIGGVSFEGNGLSVERTDQSAMIEEVFAGSAAAPETPETTASTSAAEKTATTVTTVTAASTTRSTKTEQTGTTTETTAVTESDETTEETLPETVAETEPVVTELPPVHYLAMTAQHENSFEEITYPTETTTVTVLQTTAAPETTTAVTQVTTTATTAAAEDNYKGYGITAREYLMLCNVLSHEYGGNAVPTAEKALVIEVIMNRVHSPLFPNTIYEVLTQPNQFAGIEYFIELETESYLVTQSVRDAVDLYFTDTAQFQHGYLFFNGDGTRNYFRVTA